MTVDEMCDSFRGRDIDKPKSKPKVKSFPKSSRFLNQG